MTCEIYLYEKGRDKKWKLDTSEDIQLNITYSFSDLTSPTTITDNYSKTITLPGTANNNKIFGYIYKFEREITNAYDIIGFNYNPSKRVNYDLVINDTLYQTGWLKLNKVTQILGEVKYDVTLYGDISNFLYKLSNNDIEDEENKLLYSLSFPNNLSHIINKDTLKSFIDKSNSLSGWMTYIRANNGLYDEFESSKHLTVDASGNYVVEDIMNGLEFDEIQKRECRSYYQRPALSVKGILDIIKNDETEFNVIYDDSFFNDGNPYYAKSYLTLPLLSTYDEENSKVFEFSSDEIPITNLIETEISPTVDLGIFEGGKTLSVEFDVGFNATLDITNTNNYYGYGFFRKPNMPVLKVYFVDDDTAKRYEMIPYNIFSTQLSSGKTGEFDTDWCLMVKPNSHEAYSQWQFGSIYVNYAPNRRFPVKFSLDMTEHNLNTAKGKIKVFLTLPSTIAVKYGSSAVTDTRASWKDITIYRPRKPDGTSNNLNDFYPASAGFTGNPITVSALNQIRSNVRIDKDLLLDKETTQSKFLIDYCKLFGLILDTDKKGNLSIKTRNKYFEDYDVLDWTGKLDYTQAIETNPLSFDTRTLTFKYNNTESKYEELYHNKYGLDYGELKINTGYEFNNDNKSIFDSLFENTVISKEKDRFLINNSLVVERNSDLDIPAYFSRGEANRESIDTKYNLLFDNGIKNALGNNSYWITDDSSYMLNDDIGGGDYCWLNCSNSTINQLGLSTEMYYYRQHSTLYNEGSTVCSFDIQRPRETYTGLNSVSYPESATIYSQFWKNYINEIYNVNTKEISAYFNLSFNDMNSFSFKNFILIGDTLFHPIKIENYNPLNNRATKVTLVKVNNIANYTSGQTVPSISVIYYSVTEAFSTQCSLDMPSQVAEGGTFVCNIRKRDLLGHIYLDGCELSMGGVTLNPEDYIDTETETVTIPNVTGDIVIGINCTTTEAGGDEPSEPGEDETTYSVTVAKSENCVLTYNSTVKEGDTFVCDVSIEGKADLTIDESSVTMGGEELSLSDIYNTSTNQITINNVTGNIVLSIVCVVTEYTVTLEGVGCTLTGESVINKGETYTASSHQEEGTLISLDDCVITMGGVALDAESYITGNTIMIPNVTGDLYIKIVYVEKSYTISTYTTNCSIDGPNSVKHGLDYNGTVVPINSDYVVDYENTTIMKGDISLDPNVYIYENAITVPYVDANVVLNIACVSEYWEVDTIGSHCTIEGPSKILKGETYTATITIDEGYELKLDECLIVMGRNTLDVNDYIADNTITIPNVDGNLSISIICTKIPVYYSVDWTTTGCTVTGDTSILEGEDYSATITPLSSDYAIDYSKSSIEMDGNSLDVASYVSGNKITINNVSGNIEMNIVYINQYCEIDLNGTNCTVTGATKVLLNSRYTATIAVKTNYHIDVSLCTITIDGTAVNAANYISGNTVTIPNVYADVYISIVCVIDNYTVTKSGSRCTISGSSSVDRGKTYTATITPNENCTLNIDLCHIMMGKTTLDAADYISGNTITIPNVTGDLIITIVCDLNEILYRVTYTLDNCTFNGDNTVAEGSTYTANVIPDDNYEIDLANTVIKMGNTTLSNSSVISGNKITITNVTGNISMIIVCVNTYWDVTLNGTNCSIIGDLIAVRNNPYSATIIPDASASIDLSQCSITMGGTALTISNVIDGNTINIDSVTGDVVINIVCKKSELVTTTVQGIYYGKLSTDTKYYSVAVTSDNTIPTILTYVPDKVEVVSNRTYITLPATITTRVLNAGPGCYVHIKYYESSVINLSGVITESMYNELNAGNNIDLYLLVNTSGGLPPIQ